jgi:hypothetical protein
LIVQEKKLYYIKQNIKVSYNRYEGVDSNGYIQLTPRVKYKPQSTDKEETWTRNSRMDLVSYKYYEDPNYDWLILLANDQIPFLEFEIPFGTVLKIPYPLDNALRQYTNSVYNFQQFYSFL